MTRVTISGDGSYNVYVKVSRRSRNGKQATTAIPKRPPSAREKVREPFRHSQKRKQIAEQLVMDL